MSFYHSFLLKWYYIQPTTICTLSLWGWWEVIGNILGAEEWIGVDDARLGSWVQSCSYSQLKCLNASTLMISDGIFCSIFGVGVGVDKVKDCWVGWISGWVMSFYTYITSDYEWWESFQSRWLWCSQIQPISQTWPTGGCSSWDTDKG